MFFLDNLYMGNSDYYRLFPILILLILNAFTTTSSFEILESENVDIEKEDNKIVLNIGFLIPRTGDLAPYSEGFARGAQLAINQLKQDPLFSNYTLELKEYDTKSSEQGSEQALKDAIANNSKFVIGVFSQSPTFNSVIMPLTVSSGIPFIISGYISYYFDVGAAGQSTKGSPLGIYSVDHHSHETTNVLISIYNRENYKSTTVVYRNDAWARESALLLSSSGNTGIINRLLIKYNSSAEFEEIIPQIKKAGSEAIIAFTYAKDGAKLFQRLFEQGITSYTSIYTIADSRIIGENLASKEALEGIRILVAEKEDSDEQNEFSSLFQASYNETPRYKSFEHHEAIIIGAQAYRKAHLNNSSLSDELKEYIVGTTYEWKLSRTPDFCGEALIYQVKNGNFTAELVNRLDCIPPTPVTGGGPIGIPPRNNTRNNTFFPHFIAFFAIIAIGILIRYKKIRGKRI